MTPAARHDDGGEPAAAIAAAVLAVEDVVALSAGPAGQFRTYLTGGRSVAGVRLDEDTIEVDVVLRYGPDLNRVGTTIARVVTDVAGDDRAVTVTVDDIVLPGESAADYLDVDRADSDGAP